MHCIKPTALNWDHNLVNMSSFELRWNLLKWMSFSAILCLHCSALWRRTGIYPKNAGIGWPLWCSMTFELRCWLFDFLLNLVVFFSYLQDKVMTPNLKILARFGCAQHPTLSQSVEHRKLFTGGSLLQSKQIRHLLRALRGWDYSECIQAVRVNAKVPAEPECNYGRPGSWSLSSACRPRQIWTVSLFPWLQTEGAPNLGRARKTQINGMLWKAGSSGSKYSPVVLIWFEGQRSLFTSIYLPSVVLIIHLGSGCSSQKTNNLSKLLSSNRETASVQCVGILGEREASGQQERDLKGATVNRVLKRQIWSFAYCLSFFFHSFFKAMTAWHPCSTALCSLLLCEGDPLARGTRGRQLTLQLTFFD